MEVCQASSISCYMNSQEGDRGESPLHILRNTLGGWRLKESGNVPVEENILLWNRKGRQKEFFCSSQKREDTDLLEQDVEKMRCEVYRLLSQTGMESVLFRLYAGTKAQC